MENIAKLAEGEKDADNMVSQFGLVATTSPMGAGKWRQSYAQMLSDPKPLTSENSKKG